MNTHTLDAKKPDADEYEYYSSDASGEDQIITETTSKEVDML